MEIAEGISDSMYPMHIGFNYADTIYTKFTAVPCVRSQQCNETKCIADYCQPSECIATGQCVHGRSVPIRTGNAYVSTVITA